MQCPTCQQPLEPHTYESVHVDACPSAHGLWLDEGELLTIVQDRTSDRPQDEEDAQLARQKPVAIPQEHERRPCPVCGAGMRQQTYAYESGVVIDTCATHGVWLDNGELEQIEAWVEGTERMHADEKHDWFRRLDELEREHDRREAAEAGAAFRGPFRRLAEDLGGWWLRRDEAARHRDR